MSTTIKLRRGTSTAFGTNNPTLQAGEPAFETDTGKLKIGDGTTAYNSLAYIGDGLKNNSTASNSLAILGTTTGANNTVIGSGSNCYSQTGNTIVGVSSTASSAGGNILIGNNNTGYQDTIVIGNSISTSSSNNAVRIGNSGNISSSNQGVAIGYGAKCVSANAGVAIGKNAIASNANAIQLGEGTNATASTLKFRSYQLVNSSGKIPNDRLNIDSTPTSGSSNTVSSDGVYTALAGKADSATTLSGYGITDGADTDLSNVTDNAKVLMSGMGMPSDKCTDLTLGASGSTYTAPADGYISLVYDTTATFCFCHLTIPLTGFGTTKFYSQSGLVGLYQKLEVRKGSTYQIAYGGLNFTQFRFIYAKGSESEWVDPNA